MLSKCLMSFFIILFSGTSKAQDTSYNWYALFYQSYYSGFQKMPNLRDHWMLLSNSENVVDLQELSYGLDAILATYETTDSTTYLDDAIIISNNVMNRSQITNQIRGNRSDYKDTYHGWIERSSIEPGIYMKETVLSEIYFFQYVTRLLKDIQTNKSVWKQKRYKKFFYTTLDFIETNIWNKWVSRGIRYNHNRYNYVLLGRTHMASHWAYIAAELYFLTKSDSLKRDYLSFVNLYNSRLENNFYKYDQYITWNQTWSNTKDASGIVQDVSHANLVVSYLAEAYDLGLWKDYDAIQRIINTLKDKLWDPKDCIFRDNLDGSMFRQGIPHNSVGSFQADGFVKLTRYDSTLLPIYKRFVSCSKYLTSWNQDGQLFANLALSEKLFTASH